jgi:hypothetical protein
MNENEQRVWTRYELTMTAHIQAGETLQHRELSDLSAGGASIHGTIPANDIQAVEIALDRFGNFPASVVRNWDDGFAVSFDLDKDDRYSLQEDVESFMRENDLMDDE